MGNWRNVTDVPLTVYPDGPSEPVVTAPGEVLTISDKVDHIIGTHSGVGQFEKVELETKTKAPAAPVK